MNVTTLPTLPAIPTLADGFGRRLRYVRLSITERCNFRCEYCLPDGCTAEPGPAPLSVEEIGRLARGLAAVGVERIRLTGGEPTLRRDVTEIVRTVAATPGIAKVGLTTNGYRLDALVPELRAAGLNMLNVSVDSLDPERFERITGSRHLARILAGIEAAIEAGIGAVKVNAVLLRDLNEGELDRFLAWTARRPVSVRFIELMQTGDNADFFRERHLSADTIARGLLARGWTRLEKDPGAGPAQLYAHRDHRGQVGLIAPYSAGFCETCNRVRVSSVGSLRLCLFGGDEIPLRHFLQSDADHAGLVRAITEAVRVKPAAHDLAHGHSGTMVTLSQIGG
jgi:cyclic pyranopterin phosphate synthase